MVTLGSGLTLVAFVLALYGAWTALQGGAQQKSQMLASALRSAMALFVVASFLVALLLYAFITHDFSIKYVVSYSDSQLPLFYTISALWAGQSGSLLLWAWLLALFLVLVLRQNRKQNRLLLPYVMGIIFIVLGFFFGLMVFATNPFEPTGVFVRDGNGLNPMLQNPGMVLHPPLLFLGYVGFTIPFAFAIAAMLTKKMDSAWIRSTRRWTLTAWLFLTLGIVLGAKWAYVELGWGGYWAWDPVENASLMPWLTATAFLHSVMIQERRGMLKVWNIVLIILTFNLTILGTFLTRSGIMSSVHSFGVSNLGPLFLGFLAFSLIVSLWLVYERRALLKSINHLDAFLSRESSFLYNNLVLVGIAFAVFWGTIFPVITETFRGVRVSVGPPFYNEVNVPLGLALLALTGICPLLAWRKASSRNLRRNFLYPVMSSLATAGVLLLVGLAQPIVVISLSLATFVFFSIGLEFFRGTKARVRVTGQSLPLAFWNLISRNKRRYGGYIVHLGVILMIIGIVGSNAFKQESEGILTPGDSLQVGDYTLIYGGLVDHSNKRAQIVSAEVRVESNGRYIKTLYPSRQFFPNQDPISEVDIRQTLKEDLYLILSGWDKTGRASIKALINPLVVWIWTGGMVMLIGTLIALGPQRVKKLGNLPVTTLEEKAVEVSHV